MQEAFAGLKESKDYVALSREAQKKANEYANIALKTINKEEPNALGLLAARREFDSFVNAGPRKGDVLDPTVETAKGAAGRFIRNVMNDKLKDITEGDVVHNSLDRMHNLLSARSVLRNKMYGEGNNRISRAFQRISSVANLPSTKMLSGTDKAIKAYKSDKNLVSELKADRAYIVYLMNEARQEEEENG